MTRVQCFLRVLEYNEFADRSFYRHTVTGVMQWEMPDEVRFYVEPKVLFPKAVELFDLNNFQTLTMMFSEVNRDCSGYIGEYELRLITIKIGIYVPRMEIVQLLRSRDLENKNKIAFNEVMDILVYLVSRNDCNILPIVKATFKDLAREHDLSVDGENSSIGYFSQEDYINDISSIYSDQEKKGDKKVQFRDADSYILQNFSEAENEESEHDDSGNDIIGYNGSKKERSSTPVGIAAWIKASKGKLLRRFGFRDGTNVYKVSPSPTGGKEAVYGESEKDGAKYESEDESKSLGDGSRSHFSEVGEKSPFRKSKSAQRLLEQEEAKLMHDQDMTLHVKDCMCGCRRIVELYGT